MYIFNYYLTFSKRGLLLKRSKEYTTSVKWNTFPVYIYSRIHLHSNVCDSLVNLLDDGSKVKPEHRADLPYIGHTASSDLGVRISGSH